MTFVDMFLKQLLTPDDLWEVRDRIDGFVKNATYPEVIVWADIIAENGDDPDVTHFGLACPRCGAGGEDVIREVDSSDRWNQVGEPIPSEDGVLVVDIYDADSNFQTVAYMCERCYLPCSLPSWIEEVWS